MPKNADEKRGKILEVAKRRFAHYGLAKTTMAEIAKDLAFSKALLYYYFPDKSSLFKAVIEDIADELNDETRKFINPDDGAEWGLSVVLENRITFLKKYFYIIEYTLLNPKDTPEDINELLMKSFKEQRDLVKIVFDYAVQRGELAPMDTEETASIFLNACIGMRSVVIKDLKNYFVPDKDEFDSVLLLQKKIAHIFVKGLKA